MGQDCISYLCSMAVTWHVLTRRSKGQRSHGFENSHSHMAAVAVVLLLLAWDCTLYHGCLGFYLFIAWLEI